MAGFEQTIIIGNVGRDVETKNVNGGYVASFSVGVTTRWTDKQSNERREKTNWYNVSCWNNLANVAKEYVRKGSQIMVEGTVEARAYIGQDGQPRASLNLNASNFQLLGSRDNASTDYGDAQTDTNSIPW